MSMVKSLSDAHDGQLLRRTWSLPRNEWARDNMEDFRLSDT